MSRANLGGYLAALAIGTGGGVALAPADPLGGWTLGEPVKVVLAAPPGALGFVVAGAFERTRSGVEVAWREVELDDDVVRACHAAEVGPGGDAVAWYRADAGWVREVAAQREVRDPPECALALARQALGTLTATPAPVNGPVDGGRPDGGSG